MVFVWLFSYLYSTSSGPQTILIENFIIGSSDILFLLRKKNFSKKKIQKYLSFIDNIFILIAFAVPKQENQNS